jgi:hypothetical protein
MSFLILPDEPICSTINQIAATRDRGGEDNKTGVVESGQASALREPLTRGCTSFDAGVV